MNCTPAEIVAAFIVAQGLGVAPSTAGDWRTTFGSMPSDPPDKRITAYDLAPETQGKIFNTGESVERPLVQIRARALDYRDGRVKLKAITDALSIASNVALTVNSVSVTLIAATVIQPAGYIGQEEKNTRQLYTAVVKLAIQ